MIEQDQNMLKKNFYKKGLLTYAHGKDATRFLWLHLSLFILVFISIIMLISIDYTLIFDDGITNIDPIKIVFVIALLVSLIIPLGLSFIYFGSKNYNVGRVLTGMKIIELYLKTFLVLLIIGSAIMVIMFFIVLFNNFFRGIFMGLVAGLLIWFNIKYLSLQIELVEDCQNIFNPRDDVKFKRPRPLKLKNFVIASMVIMAISEIVNLFSGTTDIPFLFASSAQLYTVAIIIISVSFLIRILMLLFTVHLLNHFNLSLLIIDKRVKEHQDKLNHME